MKSQRLILVVCVLTAAFMSMSAPGCTKNRSSKPKAATTEVESSPAEISPASQGTAAKTAEEPQETANPASLHCIENKGRLNILEDKDGSIGVCVFEDGSACEEWSFMRKQCSPGTCFEKKGICSAP